MHEIRINQNSYKSPEIQNHGTKAQEHDTEGKELLIIMQTISSQITFFNK